MPRIECRSVDELTIKQISTDLTSELADFCQIGRERFSYVPVSGEIIVDGESARSKPYIKVFWFKRSPDEQKGAAEIISKHFKAAGIKSLSVYFENLDRERTYKY